MQFLNFRHATKQNLTIFDRFARISTGLTALISKLAKRNILGTRAIDLFSPRPQFFLQTTRKGIEARQQCWTPI